MALFNIEFIIRGIRRILLGGKGSINQLLSKIVAIESV